MTGADRFDVSFPLLGFNPSGGVRMLIRVANELAARGRRVVFSVPPHAATAPVALAGGIEVRMRPAGGGARARVVFATSLPRAGVHIAGGYQTPVLIALGIQRQHAHARIVYLIQNDEVTSHVRHGLSSPLLKPLLAGMARAGYRVPATRIAVSHFVAERVGSARIHRVIPPGVDEHLLRPVAPRRTNPDRVRIGLLAHPGRVKGMDVALAAMEPLRHNAGAHVVVFDGANDAEVPAWATRFSTLQGNAPGAALDIDDFFSSIDVFVFPSWVEGFGLPPLEAMARGAAVVLTDSGGVREYARPDRNCLIVTPGDVVALRASIQQLIDDGALRNALAAAGRETALEFPAGKFAAACADEIETVLARVPE